MPAGQSAGVSSRCDRSRSCFGRGERAPVAGAHLDRIQAAQCPTTKASGVGAGAWPFDAGCGGSGPAGAKPAGAALQRLPAIPGRSGLHAAAAVGQGRPAAGAGHEQPERARSAAPSLVQPGAPGGGARRRSRRAGALEKSRQSMPAFFIQEPKGSAFALRCFEGSRTAARCCAGPCASPPAPAGLRQSAPPAGSRGARGWRAVQRQWRLAPRPPWRRWN